METNEHGIQIIKPGTSAEARILENARSHYRRLRDEFPDVWAAMEEANGLDHMRAAHPELYGGNDGRR